MNHTLQNIVNLFLEKNKGNFNNMPQFVFYMN